ncbi:hypothetical protein, partial [Collinsella aerofaciens]|uniref:hypothetical protein n=1 Tax=Collinsella aerofaciens TaxID=74426 RepID=UPI0034A1FC19
MGKLIPFCAYRVGCGFPKVPLGETTSRFMPLKWDAVSRRGPSGKRHPILSLKSGIRFPAGMKKAPTAHMNCLPFLGHEKWEAFFMRVDLRVKH